MKKIIAVVTFFLLSGIAYSQTDSLNNKMNQQSNTKSGQNTTTYPSQNGNNKNNIQSVPDGYRMQKGKVMVSSNGRVTPLEKEITFNDGSILRSDGTITRKNGSKQYIKDDEYVDITGKVVKSDKNKDMYLVPDSTNTNK